MLDQVGKCRELPARDGLGKRRELGCLGRNVARRQTGGKLAEQLGCLSGHHEHARRIGRRRSAIVRHGALARLYQLVNSVRIGIGADMGTGHLYKGRPGGGLRRSSILPQRRDLKQHAAGIKGRSKFLAHCRLLAGEQHDDLSPAIRHGRQQPKQTMCKRRDAAHEHRAGAGWQIVGQGAGHHVGRLAGLDHISAVQAARIGTQKLKHTSLGVAFGLGLANAVAAALGTRSRHARKHIAGHACEHAHRALAARKRL